MTWNFNAKLRSKLSFGDHPGQQFQSRKCFFLTLVVKTVVAACSSDPSLLFLILSNTVSNFLTDLVFPGFQKRREWQAMWPPREKHWTLQMPIMMKDSTGVLEINNYVYSNVSGLCICNYIDWINWTKIT